MFRVRRSAFILALLLTTCRDRPEATTTDDLGRALAVPPRVERIVTLAPNLTEMIYAVGGGEKIVGTDDFSDYPPDAEALPKVGGMQPNVEKIATLAPDLVVASTEGNHPNLAPALAAAAIPLYVVRTDRLAQIAPAMKRIGDLLEAPRTDAAVRELERGIAVQRRNRADPPRVLFAVWTDPLYVAGQETFTDDLLQLTGAQNAVGVRGWPQYSLESLAAAPPDIILHPRDSVTRDQIDALLARIPGVNPEIVAVEDDVFQRPGPRVTEAARALNAILDGMARRESRPSP